MFARSALTLAIVLSLNHTAFAENNNSLSSDVAMSPDSIFNAPAAELNITETVQQAKHAVNTVAHSSLESTNNTAQQPSTQLPIADVNLPVTDINTLPTATADLQPLTAESIDALPPLEQPVQVSDQESAEDTVQDVTQDNSVDSSPEADSNTEQQFQNAEAIVHNLPKNPHTNSAQAPQQQQDWSLEGLNSAEWVTDLGKGQFTAYAKAQVLLNRHHSSPGTIDGISGKNMLKAISAFQVMQGLPVDGQLNSDTWAALNQGQYEPTFINYTISQEDLDSSFAKSIPRDYAEQAKMKGLYYTRMTEMLAERFHMDETFLKKLNPQTNFKAAGESIIVANPREETDEPIAFLIAHKGAKQLYAFDSNNKMVASFPATIGSASTPSPKGSYKIRAIAPYPWYGYSPKNFIQGNNLKPLSLPPGPNNPVGVMWIALSKPSFGIHGTPNPSTISKTASHGCIRLTNWDATSLSMRVKKGVGVKFVE